MLTTHERSKHMLDITSANAERQATQVDNPGRARVRLKRPRDLFAQVDRNLMNYPLARDPRVKAIWSKSKTGRWFCDLPADERIRLRLAHGADARLKRVPSAFDVNVLLLVFARAQIQGDPVVTFPSRAAIFQALGLSLNRAGYCERVDAALAFWSALTIRMPWHPDNKTMPYKTMPPPIEVACRKGSALTVTVTPAWRDLGKKKTGYFKQVPLPLPHDAATQNLVLSLLTCVSEEFDCDGEIMRSHLSSKQDEPFAERLD